MVSGSAWFKASLIKAFVSSISFSDLYELIAIANSFWDAKIYVCSGGYSFNTGSDRNANCTDSESNLNKDDNLVAALETDPTQEAEFIYLFQHFSNECRSLFSDEYSDNKEDLMKISGTLKQVELVVKHLHQQISGKNIENNETNNNSQGNLTQIEGVLELCESLKKSVEALSSHIPCQHCLKLQNAMDR